MGLPWGGVWRGASILAAVVGLTAAAPAALADIPPVPTVDRAPSALNATLSSGSSSSGNGGNSSSASSGTNTFSPAAFVNYNSFGGEPTTVVDRYPITTGTYNGRNCSGSSPCYPDLVYVSNPLSLAF